MNYTKYRDVFAQSLLNPTDTELKLDLQQLEDQLDILNIVIAREHAKIQVNTVQSIIIEYFILYNDTKITVFRVIQIFCKRKTNAVFALNHS